MVPAERSSKAPQRKSKAGRKAGSSKPSSTVKSTAKSPRERLAADSLQWKAVKNTASFAGIDEGGGMMMLEELDDVGVEWTEENGAKIAKFVAAEGKKSKGKGKAKADGKQSKDFRPVEDTLETMSAEDEVWEGIAEDGPSEQAESVSGEAEVDLLEERPFDDALLPDWTGIDLHTALKRSLLALGFVKPTEIQRRSVGPGSSGRDIVGVAETGSGKTLAYSLPVLSYLLRTAAPSRSGRRPLAALILCPTRELALQVVDHLQKVVKHALEGDRPGPPRISVGSVVGGLSAQKQKRIVERGCDILVATPGRLWDLIKTDEELALGIRKLRYVIIDEADRMIENGHFAELESIVRLTQRTDNRTSGPDDDDPIFAANSSLFNNSSARPDMQTFVFSATLSKDLQQNLKKRHRATPKSGKNGKKASALEDLVERLDFRDENPEVIDLSPVGGVVAALKESMVECVIADKDLYLYYFLLRYPGRSLVFVGSIDGIRRLVPLFETLQVPIFPLHSQLQQKQRLKNLDRFKSSSNGVLIATDVAARGLDIPNVEHVIHFNLPRTADAYIHRSGRTARAQNPGFALQLCAPEEKGMQRALMNSLGRTTELPDLPIESGFLPKLRERITLARDIEKAQHQVKKENHDKNWLRETAEAMDLDIDPSMLSEEEEDPDAPYHKKTRRVKQDSGRKTTVPALKAELKALLAQPLMARGVSARYPTSGTKVIVGDLINSTGHETLLGASTAKAYDEVHKARARALLKRKRPVKK